MLPPLAVSVVVWVIVRLVRRGKHAPAFSRVAFWTILVAVGLQLLGTVGDNATRSFADFGEAVRITEGDDAYILRAIEKHEARLSQIPEFRHLVQSQDSVSSEAWVEGVPSATPARFGLLRLSDADLEERFRLLRRMTSTMPEHSCANFARGRSSRKDLFAALEHLDSAAVDRWFALSYYAFIAEVNGTPPSRTVTDVEVDAAWQIVAGQEPAQELDRFFAIAADPGAHDDGELCWLQRTYDRYILSLPPEHRSVLLRSAIQQP